MEAGFSAPLLEGSTTSTNTVAIRFDEASTWNPLAPALQRWKTRDVAAYIEQRLTGVDDERDVEDLAQVQPDPVMHTPFTSITYREVSFTVRIRDPARHHMTNRLILSPCSGHFHAGRMVAIMGPSGCGKSTLLDILANKKSSYGGDVFMNGHPRDHLFSRVTSYVPQVDVMPTYWLVKEAIRFNQMLKQQRPSRVSVAQRDRIVDAITRDLGLQSVQNTIIGSESVRGISGGQRRRVTLARGLITGACAIFCDEPTSGARRAIRTEQRRAASARVSFRWRAARRWQASRRRTRRSACAA